MEKQARKHADLSPSGGGNTPSSSSSSTSSKTRKNNPLKKKEKDTEVMGRPSRNEMLNADHEVFIQAFEKPTQIYRFLRTRNVLKPIFLHRNLTYMRNRMSRSHKSRQSFKIDSMLAQKMTKLRSEKSNDLTMSDGYLTLFFLGFFDERNQTMRNGADSNGIVLPLKSSFTEETDDSENNSDYDRKCVQVETNLLKIAHTKRKDMTATQMQLTVGKSQVLVNPKDDQQSIASSSNGLGVDEKPPIVSIPTDSFNTNGVTSAVTGPQVSFILRFRVQYMVPSSNGTNEQHYLTNGTVSDGEEPSAKRQKLHGHCKMYSTELTLFDKYGRCLLKEADYELAVREIISHQKVVTAKYGSPMKSRYWGAFTDSCEIMDYMPLDDCSKSDAVPPTSEDFIDRYEEMIKPILKVRLQWTKEPPHAFETAGAEIKMENGYSDKENHKPPSPSATDSFKKGLNININNNSILTPAAAAGHLDDVDQSLSEGNDAEDSSINDVNADLALVAAKLSTPKNVNEAKVVVYHFMHNNFSRQQTENMDRFTCPWCCLSCGMLYSLLKHLKLCHGRFNFNYVPIPEGARIDVTINELYDGSYNGSPHDLLVPMTAYTVRDPLRRTVVTNLLVCRPRRPKPSLAEFIDNDENEFDSQRPYITGHSRMYHHTMTCLPVYPRELDIDSEGESDPLWLQQKTMQMIDEFTDVNEGEKELMKMWNLHVMKYGYVGDCQIPIALEMFIDLRGRELMARNLYRNFVLHMCSMFDFGLVSADVMQRIIRKLRKIPANDTELQQTVKQARTEQMNYWNNVTVHKQQTVKTELRNGNGERTAGTGASTSISGSSSYHHHQHHKSGHGVSGSGPSNTGDGQQRKVKPTITPAKNTDPGAILPRSRRSASNMAKGGTPTSGKNGGSVTQSSSSSGKATNAPSHSTTMMAKPPSGSGKALSSSQSATAGRKSSTATKSTASPSTSFASTNQNKHQNNHNHPPTFSPIMTRRKSLSLGSHLLLRKRSLN
ncbi:polycomb protein suz12 isoform X1 [Anopheles funestus]|uniref:polycomb protein suz12 isoform X1 n=1 Tax=Anopheles funestus TaxID=62324 RepID=UPI0020C6F0FB|nr:polycomb protein suz12 isoform X1 [Anopheles funestus]